MDAKWNEQKWRYTQNKDLSGRWKLPNIKSI